MTGELVRWWALVTLLAVGCWAAPHAKDVDPGSLITKPDQGNQFVHFQTGPAKSKIEPEFSTSHKIPGRDPPIALEPEEAEYAASLKVKHVKREAGENEKNSSSVEYKVVTSMSQHSSEDDGPIKVDIRADAGLLEDKQASEDELKIMSTKKATSLSEGTKKVVLKEKQEDHLTAEVTAESETGVQNPKFQAGPEDISLLPSKMPENESPRKNDFEVVPVNLPKGKSHGNKDDVDFVDSPFADKVLVPAGAGNQQSRIEIKKGPNGQDYEYEYVYYYEDDEEAADGASPLPSTTSTTPPTRRYLPTESSSSAAGGANSRGGSERGKSRQSSQGSESGGDDRKRYTNIERTTSPVPEANEVVPSRGGGRHRGRNLSTPAPETTTEDVAERLPSNTRFPPRSRGTAAAATTTPAATPSTVSRTRGGSSGGSVRRPSLELVDSQSFRTHSSSSGEPDQPSFPSVLPADPAPVTEDLDDFPTPQRRPTIRRPPSSTAAPVSTDEFEDEDDEPPPTPIGGGRRTPEFSQESTIPQSTDEPGLSTGEQPEENPDGLSAMMDKAALELYAALQQASLNSLDPAEAGDPEGVYTTELDLTTTPEPTTTTTTPIPTTTTTTTTEAPITTTEAPVGRRNGPKARRPSRFKSSSSGSTSTTTESSQESSTRARGRFGGTKNGNGFGGRKAGGRTTPKPLEDSAAEGAQEKESTKEAAPARTFSPNRFNSGTSRRRGSTTSAPTTSGESATTNSASKPTAHHDRYNLRARRPGRVTTPAAPAEEEHDEEGSSQTSESTAAPSKPTTRARVNLANGNRLSLRPGPRLNLGRPGASTSPVPSTTPPPTENEGETEEEENHSSSPESEDNLTTTPVPALTRLRNRPRLRLQPKAAAANSNPNPIRRGPSPLLRKKQVPAAEAAEEKAPQAEEKEEGEHEETNNGESVGSEAETTPATETPAASEPKGLSGLLAGRRRIPGGRIRTPGTLAQRAP